jgi:hypothetical protein
MEDIMFRINKYMHKQNNVIATIRTCMEILFAPVHPNLSCPQSDWRLAQSIRNPLSRKMMFDGTNLE